MRDGTHCNTYHVKYSMEYHYIILFRNIMNISIWKGLEIEGHISKSIEHFCPDCQPQNWCRFRFHYFATIYMTHRWPGSGTATENKQNVNAPLHPRTVFLPRLREFYTVEAFILHTIRCNDRYLRQRETTKRQKIVRAKEERWFKWRVNTHRHSKWAEWKYKTMETEKSRIKNWKINTFSIL